MLTKIRILLQHRKLQEEYEELSERGPTMTILITIKIMMKNIRSMGAAKYCDGDRTVTMSRNPKTANEGSLQ